MDYATADARALHLSGDSKSQFFFLDAAWATVVVVVGVCDSFIISYSTSNNTTRTPPENRPTIY